MSVHNKELIKKRFARSLEQYDKQSIVQTDICCRIGSLLDEYVDRDVVERGNAYEFGAGTGFLTKILLSKYPKASWRINDIVEQTQPYINSIASASEVENINITIADAENYEIPEKLSIVASSSSIQWFNSLEGFMNKISKSIVDGGYFVFSTFGKHNFYQIAELTPDLNIGYYSLEQIEEWASKSGFKVLFSDQYNKDMKFDTPQHVLRYIKETGINGNSNRVWTKSAFKNFCVKYSERHSVSDKVLLSFNPMIFILQKDTEVQQ